jgi:hypothetical protein
LHPKFFPTRDYRERASENVDDAMVGPWTFKQWWDHAVPSMCFNSGIWWKLKY